MTRGQVQANISRSLYIEIVKEKARLKAKELKKVKSRRNIITMVTASQSLARKLR